MSRRTRADNTVRPGEAPTPVHLRIVYIARNRTGGKSLNRRLLQRFASGERGAGRRRRRTRVEQRHQMRARLFSNAPARLLLQRSQFQAFQARLQRDGWLDRLSRSLSPVQALEANTLQGAR